MSDSTTAIGIAMGSESDLPVMQDAAELLDNFDLNYEMRVLSAHRTPAAMKEYAESAHERGLKVIIAGAGGAAHLPGMIAASTPLPVLGVPVKTSKLNGLDSLLSIVQMPAAFQSAAWRSTARKTPRYSPCKFWPRPIPTSWDACSNTSSS